MQEFPGRKQLKTPNKNCKYCGEPFYVPPCFFNTIVYCSAECRKKDQRIRGICRFCGKVISIQKNRGKVLFCNNKCYTEWKKQQIGKKCFAWKNGNTPIEKAERKRSEYKDWRKAVFERDNFICQICLKRGEKLNAHHIKSFSKYPDSRYDVSNGITLCISCHRSIHKSCGFSRPSDYIAALNIRAKAFVSEPMVTG